MTTILWTQNEAPTIPDTIIVDGKICSDENIAQNAFDLLNLKNQNLSLTPQDRETLYKKFRHLGVSHQANYKEYFPGVYLQGCFLDEDKVGRKLPFMFFDGNATSIKEGIKSLKELASLAHRKCNEQELAILEDSAKHLNQHKRIATRFVIPVILAVFILITIVILT